VGWGRHRLQTPVAVRQAGVVTCTVCGYPRWHTDTEGDGEHANWCERVRAWLRRENDGGGNRPYLTITVDSRGRTIDRRELACPK
jgi:hypothetical protein